MLIDDLLCRTFNTINHMNDKDDVTVLFWYTPTLNKIIWVYNNLDNDSNLYI